MPAFPHGADSVTGQAAGCRERRGAKGDRALELGKTPREAVLGIAQQLPFRRAGVERPNNSGNNGERGRQVVTARLIPGLWRPPSAAEKLHGRSVRNAVPTLRRAAPWPRA